MEWSTAVQVVDWCVSEMLDKIPSGPTTMGRDEPTKSWKRGKEFCEGEMETAFLVILNFCVQVMGPPRCGHIEDERGPYQTQQECEERIHEMFNYMNTNFPPNSVDSARSVREG